MSDLSKDLSNKCSEQVRVTTITTECNKRVMNELTILVDGSPVTYVFGSMDCGVDVLAEIEQVVQRLRDLI